MCTGALPLTPGSLQQTLHPPLPRTGAVSHAWSRWVSPQAVLAEPMMQFPIRSPCLSNRFLRCQPKQLTHKNHTSAAMDPLDLAPARHVLASPGQNRAQGPRGSRELQGRAEEGGRSGRLTARSRRVWSLLPSQRFRLAGERGHSCCPAMRKAQPEWCWSFGLGPSQLRPQRGRRFAAFPRSVLRLAAERRGRLQDSGF